MSGEVLDKLVQACELVDEYNDYSPDETPKIVGFVILTPEGELIQQVPARVADDVIRTLSESQLMNTCECNECVTKDKEDEE